MKLIHVFFSVLCLVFVVVHTNGAKLLLVFQVPSYSHYILGNKLMHLLVDRGHEVTLVSPYKDRNPPKLCREVFLAGIEIYYEKIKEELFAKNESRNVLKMISHLVNMGPDLTEKVLTHPTLKGILANPNEQFDVIIIEEVVSHALKALGYRFKAPLISFSTIGPSRWVNSILRNPAPGSYVPDILFSYNGSMTFWQRTQNVFMVWFIEIVDRFFIVPRTNSVIDRVFPGAPHVDELNENVALVLLNSHVSTNQPVPVLPNMIEIGGYHVDPPKQLPEDLQRYLDGAKNGVVYFSLGSNMKSNILPNQTKEAFLGAFRKLKMDVLWKWEEDELPEKPANVKVAKWFPQQDVLAHPNVKLFITHGGLLSTIETIYHGVPAIAIPEVMDHQLNAANAVTNGYAVQLDLYDLSEEKLIATFNEVLQNPKYAEDAKKRSQLMHDRLVSPKESAVYWIEYVLRHKGEKHFRSAALDLAWYQLYSLDIIGAVLLIFIVISNVIWRVFRRICKKRISSEKKKKD